MGRHRGPGPRRGRHRRPGGILEIVTAGAALLAFDVWVVACLA